MRRIFRSGWRATLTKEKVQIFLAAVFIFLGLLYALDVQLQILYKNQLSVRVFDRNGEEVAILKNPKGYYVRPVTEPPRSFATQLIKKEDRYFYWHPGINPLSI